MTTTELLEALQGIREAVTNLRGSDSGGPMGLVFGRASLIEDIDLLVDNIEDEQ